jgi:hypothetical protein
MKVALVILCLSGHAASIPVGRPSPVAGAGDVFERRPGESDSGFVFRTAPAPRPKRLIHEGENIDTVSYGAPQLFHGPLSVIWNSQPVILVFYADTIYEAMFNYRYDNCSQAASSYTDHEKNFEAQGYVYVPAEKPGRYRRLFVGSLGAFGSDPEVGAVFFANADADTRKELAVLSCSAADPSRGEGRECATRLFDDLESAHGDTLAYLEKVSDRLSMDVIPARGKRKESYVFYDLNTAAQVKARLKRLGY